MNNINDLYVGGIMASLMPDRIVAATGIERSHILTGLFTDTSVVGDDNDINVDELPLDYDILEQVDYKYPAGDNYFAYTTRGCPNHCSFCAVPILEPHFHVTNNIIDQIKTIDEKYGPKQHLLLLDNNVLNTKDLKALVDDLYTAGFGRGAKYVDPGAYNIVMMRYKNGDRAEFLDKKMVAYLEGFKKRIKSAEMLETFLQIVIGAEDAEDYAQYTKSILKSKMLLLWMRKPNGSSRKSLNLPIRVLVQQVLLTGSSKKRFLHPVGSTTLDTEPLLTSTQTPQRKSSTIGQSVR